MQRLWVPCVILVVMLSGCATTDVTLTPPASGLKTPIPGGNQRQVVVAIPFSDARQITNRCGLQRSGYGDETATAYCEGDPTHWLAAMLAGELEASGFTVLAAEQGGRDSALKIEGVLLKIFAEPVVGAWTTTIETDLSVRLVATSRTGLRAERTFFVKGDRESVVWTQGVFNESLERGARELLGKMVEAILELMKQYPDLGFAPPLPARLVGWQRDAER
jgi:hypothetical protein